MTDQQIITARMRRASGLGDTGLNMRFDNYDIHKGNRRGVNAIKRWIKGKQSKPGILLHGDTRIGKTHLACAAANELIEHGKFCKFLRTVDMPKEDTEAVQELACSNDTPYLVLDDLGAEKLTERALECLYIVIDGRLWERGPVIVTTNHVEQSLRRIWNDARACEGDRLVGRLLEMCVFVAMHEE